MDWFRHHHEEEKDSDLRIDVSIPPPRVRILLPVYQKLFAYAAACATEVGGLGFVERVGNDFLITDVFTLPQKATGASADLDDGAVHTLIHDMVLAGRSPEELRLQWHSHGDMPVYCSSIDHELIADYQCDVMISLVVNQRGEHHCRFDLYKPVRIGFEVVLQIVIPPPDEAIRAQCESEVTQHVQQLGLRAAFHRVFGRFGRRVTERTIPAVADLQELSLDVVIPASATRRPGGGK